MADKKFDKRCDKSAMCSISRNAVEKGIKENDLILNSELLGAVEEKCKCKHMTINAFIEAAVERAIAAEAGKSEDYKGAKEKSSIGSIMERAVEKGIEENNTILNSELLGKVVRECKCREMDINKFIEQAVERAIAEEDK